MGQKTISLPEDVYEKLKSEKRDDESFSQLILRLLKKDRKLIPIEALAGAFEEDSSEWERIEQFLYNDRLKPSERNYNIME
ncbi:MAG: antitoxin VapB family protein [Candidatus Helarchaeota archaeon]